MINPTNWCVNKRTTGVWLTFIGRGSSNWGFIDCVSSRSTPFLIKKKYSEIKVWKHVWFNTWYNRLVNYRKYFVKVQYLDINHCWRFHRWRQEESSSLGRSEINMGLCTDMCDSPLNEEKTEEVNLKTEMFAMCFVWNLDLSCVLGCGAQWFQLFQPDW